MAYLKNYKPESIKLGARIKGDTAYLHLSFNFGYYTSKITATGALRTEYETLRVATSHTLDAKHWVDGDFSPVFQKNNRSEYSKMLASVEAQRQRIFGAYTALIEKNGCKPSPEQIIDLLKGRQAQQVRVPIADYIMEFARTAHAEKPRTIMKYATLAELMKVVEAARGSEPFKKWAVGSGPIYLHTYNENDWADMTTMIRKAACRLTITFRNEGVRGLKFVGQGSGKAIYNSNTLEKVQQNMRAVLNYAIRKKHPVCVDPKMLDKVRRNDSEKTCLNVDELNVLINARLEGNQENARRLFVAQCFTGVPVGDLDTLLNTPIDIIKGRQVTFHAVTMVRSKTNTPFCVPLFAPALEILQSEDKPAKPPHDQTYNEQLKAVCKRLGFNRTVHEIHAKADGTMTQERLPLWDTVSSHMGRAVFKNLMQFDLACQRERVCDAMAHAYGDKDADRGYERIPRERRAELLYLQASMEADKLPFPLIARVGDLKRA